MIELTPLHEALVGELRDLYDAEQRVLTRLSHMAATARTQPLRQLAARLLVDAGHQLARLEESFRLLDEDVSGRHSLGMARILDRRSQPSAPGTPDADFATAARGAAHFLSAVHATAAARARALGYLEIAGLLDASVDEARTAGRELTLFTAPTAGSAGSADARR